MFETCAVVIVMIVVLYFKKMKKFILIKVSTRTFDELIKDGGYEYIDPLINDENFRVRKIGKKEVVNVKLLSAKKVSSWVEEYPENKNAKELIEGMENELETHGYRLLKNREWLTFCAQYNTEKSCTIITLKPLVESVTGRIHIPFFSINKEKEKKSMWFHSLDDIIADERVDIYVAVVPKKRLTVRIPFTDIGVTVTFNK